MPGTEDLIGPKDPAKVSAATEEKGSAARMRSNCHGPLEKTNSTCGKSLGYVKGPVPATLEE